MGFTFGGGSGGFTFAGKTSSPKHSGGHSILAKILGAPAGFVTHLGSDVKDAVVGLPTGMATLVEHPERAGKAIARQTWHDWSPLIEGHPIKFAQQTYEHPLAPLLDVATVFSAGAGVAAKLGKVAETAGAEGRLVKAAASLGKPSSRMVKDTHAVTEGRVARPPLPKAYGRSAGANLRRSLANRALLHMEPHLPAWFKQTAREGRLYDRLHTIDAAHRVAATNLQINAFMRAGKAVSDPSMQHIIQPEILSHNYWNLRRFAHEIDANAQIPDNYRYVKELTSKNKDSMFAVKLDANGNPLMLDRRLSPEQFGQDFLTKSRSEAAFTKGGKKVLIVPRHDAENLAREGANSTKFLRTLAHKPVVLWKRVNVGYAPRVITNNAVGNWMMHAMRTSGDGGTRGIIDAIKYAHGNRAAMKAFKEMHSSIARGEVRPLEPISTLKPVSESMPPVPHGFVRMYRGEGSAPSIDMSDPVARANAALHSQPQAGRWFSPDRKYAETYPRGASKEQLLYVDVPHDVLERPSVSQIKGREHILPREHAEQARPVINPVPHEHASAASSMSPAEAAAKFTALAHPAITADPDIAAIEKAFGKRAADAVKHPPDWQRQFFSDELGSVFSNVLDDNGKGSKLLRQGFYPVVHRVADEPVRVAALYQFMRNAPEVKSFLTTHPGVKLDEAIQSVLKKNPAKLRERAVQHVRSIAGDYTTMGKYERLTQNIVPFYLWDKHIAKHFANMVSEKPGRVVAMQQTSRMGNEEAKKLLGALPSFMEGALPLSLFGMHEHNQRTPLLMTSGLNPYHTIGELAQFATSATTRHDPASGADAASQLSPLLTGLVEQISGHKIGTQAPPDTHGGVLPSVLANTATGTSYGTLIKRLIEGTPQPKRNAQGKTKPFLYQKTAGETLEGLFGFPMKNVSLERAHQMSDQETGKKKRKKNATGFTFAGGK
jgi:hypothetical protein